MYTLADTQKALTALALRHGDDAAILAQVVANITCATTHKCKDQIAAKLHSGWTPHRSKPWGSLGDTSGASTVIGVKCKKPGRGGP